MKKYFILLFVFLLSFTLYQPIANAEIFTDVPKKHPNYYEIGLLLDNGVITNDSNEFGVNEIVTREEVAVMVAKAVGLDGTPRATKFKDVSINNINSGYIQSAAEAGILGGYSDGTFKPNNKVTRGQMAVFIANAFDLPKGINKFSDMKPGMTGYNEVSKLVAAGITVGYEDGTFRSKNNLTRAHISAFLAKAIKFSEGYDTITDLKPYNMAYLQIGGDGFNSDGLFTVRQKSFTSSSNIMLRFSGYNEYILDGKYSKITAGFAVDDSSSDFKYSNGQLTIYGDDEILFSTKTLKQGDEPVEIDMPITSVNTLKIEYAGTAYSVLYDIKFFK